MFLNVDNVGAERMSSGTCRLFQATGPATEMHGCRVVALFWVQPNHHELRNGTDVRYLNCLSNPCRL